jgi:hypothetical protein
LPDNKNTPDKGMLIDAEIIPAPLEHQPENSILKEWKKN